MDIKEINEAVLLLGVYEKEVKKYFNEYEQLPRAIKKYINFGQYMFLMGYMTGSQKVTTFK